MIRKSPMLLLLALVLWLAMSCDVGEPTSIPLRKVTPLPTITSLPTLTPLPTVTPDSYAAITVTDSRGSDVVFHRAPQRIVSLSPAHTEILYALGLGDRVVGVDSYSNFPTEAGAKPKVGDAFTLNLETLAALEPDLVYTTFEGPVADVEGLGIKALYLFPASDIQGVLDNITLIGQITDREEQAQALVEDMAARIDAVVDSLAGVGQGPRVFYEIDPGLWTVGPGSFVGDILQMLHVQNVAEGASSPYPQLSAEVIVEKDPEVIVLGDSREYLATGIDASDVTGRPGWSSLTAVRENRVYPFDDSLLSRPGPRIAEGIEKLARLLYPDVLP